MAYENTKDSGRFGAVATNGVRIRSRATRLQWPMPGWLPVAFIAATLLFVSPSGAWAYTAGTIQDLSNYYDSYLSTASGFDTLNGQTIDWYTNADGTKTIQFGAGYLDGVLAWSPNDKNGVVQALANNLGIAPEEIFISSKNSSGAAQATSSEVFTTLVMPAPTTAARKDKGAEQKRLGLPRAVAAAVRYSYVDTPADNGYVAGLNLGLAWDFDQVTVGFLLPYDYTDFDNLLTAQRVGMVLFGQYSMPISNSLSSRYTAYVDYSDTSIDYNAGGDNHLATHGGGVGASLTWKAAGLANTLAASVQEHRDNSGGDRTFDTLRVAGGTSLPMGKTQVLGLNTTLTRDFSDYDAAYENRNLYEVGLTYRNDLSDTWGLSISVNHKFDYNDLSTTEVYIGSAMSF